MAGSAASEPTAYVRLTCPAFQDLTGLLKKDPQIVRWALKKMLLLERNPEAGEPLLGTPVGWRKLTVGDRNWRIVWRVGVDDSGSITITIAEIWAVGARSDAAVYDEVTARVAAAPRTEASMALSEVIQLLGKHASTTAIRPMPEPVPDPVPHWLRDRLVHTADLSFQDVAAMTGSEAMTRWERYMTDGE